MIPYERRQEMLKLLGTKDVVQLGDFCETLSDVSESTIRRDLKTLEAEGQVTLLRGGGVKLRQGSYDVPVNSKTIVNVSAKEKIAGYAASLVQDGEDIYIDAGSTVLSTDSQRISGGGLHRYGYQVCRGRRGHQIFDRVACRNVHKSSAEVLLF